MEDPLGQPEILLFHGATLVCPFLRQTVSIAEKAEDNPVARRRDTPFLRASNLAIHVSAAIEDLRNGRR